MRRGRAGLVGAELLLRRQDMRRTLQHLARSKGFANASGGVLPTASHADAAQRLMRTAAKMDKVLDAVTEELPGTAAAARLTSLELADCFLEFRTLGSEVTGGLRAGARAMEATERSMQEGTRVLHRAVTEHIVPGVRERARATAGAHDLAPGLTLAPRLPLPVALVRDVSVRYNGFSFLV